MKDFIILFLLFISVSAFGQAFTMTEPAPFDPEISTGVLSNGMTYYIKANKEPENRASFYIIQNVGAILENDNQNGLAHFLEHMAFNGTENYPGKNMLNMLERHGVKFGNDVNAYTSRNETVYNISNVPVKDRSLIDSCLLILHDWSNYLVLSDEEIDAERGVISEEWRTRRNAQFRTMAITIPEILNHSKYAKRDVIGSLDVIQNFKYNELRDFYHDWYRTDLQAIAIIGDFDVDSVESKVIELFSRIPAVEDPMERPFIEIKDNIQPGFVIAADKEVQLSTISLLIRHRDSLPDNLNKLRNDYLINAFNQLISSRISEKIQQGDAKYISGSIRISGLVRGYRALSISASSEPGKEDIALADIMTDFEQLFRNGFMQTELDRVKKKMLVQAELSYKKRDQISNDAYARLFRTAYLKMKSVPDSKFVYDFASYAIPSLSLEELSAFARDWYTDKNKVISITCSDENAIALNEKKTFEIIDSIATSPIEVYEDLVVESDLLGGQQVSGGSIVSERQLPGFNATEWELSNGTKVIYRFADYEKEEVVLSGYSYGGTSLYESEVLPTAKNIATYTIASGIGEHDPIALKRIMTGSTASVNAGINPFNESLSGSSAPWDIETMLQLLYMRFEMPRFDSAIFNTRIDRYKKQLSNREANPNTLISDTVMAILNKDNPRYRKVDTTYLEDIEFSGIEKIYKERFADASDYTFFIVGDIQEAELKPLVAKYIGGITDIDRDETWIDRDTHFPEGDNHYKIAIPMKENKSTVIIKMQKDAPYTRENTIYQSIISSILTLRFTEEIREKEGGTYGVGVYAGSSRLPEGSLSLNIQFDCDPERAEYLKSLIYKELDKLQKEVGQDDLQKVVLNMKKNAEQQKEHNNYWLSALRTYYMTGMNPVSHAYFDDIVNEVSTKDIQKAAKRFFKKADILDIVITPEN